MVTSDIGIKLITKFEGCKLVAYQDSGGVWTIGYGHTGGVTPGMIITNDIALLYLKSDLKNAEKYVRNYDNIYHFTQNQFDALVSFTYNAGAGNLRKLLNAGKLHEPRLSKFQELLELMELYKRKNQYE